MVNFTLNKFYVLCTKLAAVPAIFAWQRNFDKTVSETHFNMLSFWNCLLSKFHVNILWKDWFDTYISEEIFGSESGPSDLIQDFEIEWFFVLFLKLFLNKAFRLLSNPPFTNVIILFINININYYLLPKSYFETEKMRWK